MSSKEIIKNFLIDDLKTSSSYAEILLIKEFIIKQIESPGVNSMNIVYNFTNQLTDEQLQIFKLCFKIEFGWINENVNQYSCVIDLSKFLE